MQSICTNSYLILRVLLFICVAFLLFCGPQTHISRDWNRTPRSNVRVVVELNDSTFSTAVVNNSLNILREFNPYPRVTPKIAYLIDSLSRIKVPKARVVVVNASSVPLLLPMDGQRNSLPADTGYWMLNTLAYHFGKEGSDSAWNLWHGPIGCMVDQKGRFHEAGGGDSVVVADSIEFISWEGVKDYGPGRYWLVVYYQNYYREKSDIEYFIGIVKSDTAWMRFVDTNSVEQTP